MEVNFQSFGLLYSASSSTLDIAFVKMKTLKSWMKNPLNESTQLSSHQASLHKKGWNWRSWRSKLFLREMRFLSNREKAWGILIKRIIFAHPGSHLLHSVLFACFKVANISREVFAEEENLHYSNFRISQIGKMVNQNSRDTVWYNCLMKVEIFNFRS